MPKDEPHPEYLVTHAQELIDPALAREYLLKTAGNRKIDKIFVALMARQIRRKAWRDNGQGIIFDSHGRLLTGHHRLHAIIAADTGVWLSVMRGADPNSQPTIDQGRKWSKAAIANSAGLKNNTQASAVTTVIWGYLAGLTLKKSSVTADECLDLRMSDDRIDQWTLRVTSEWRSQVAAVLFLATQESDEYLKRAEEFCLKARTGENLDHNSPILALRNIVMRGIPYHQSFKLTGKNIPPHIRLKIVIHCWNNFANGTSGRLTKNFLEGEIPDIVGALPYGALRNELLQTEDEEPIVKAKPSVSEDELQDGLEV